VQLGRRSACRGSVCPRPLAPDLAGTTRGLRSWARRSARRATCPHLPTRDLTVWQALLREVAENNRYTARTCRLPSSSSPPKVLERIGDDPLMRVGFAVRYDKPRVVPRTATTTDRTTSESPC
jgi:hypothetical protein